MIRQFVNTGVREGRGLGGCCMEVHHTCAVSAGARIVVALVAQVVIGVNDKSVFAVRVAYGQ